MSLFRKRRGGIAVEEETAERNWKIDIIDAGVVGGLAVFSNLLSLGVTNIVSADPKEIVATIIVSFGVGFFSTLAAKWGLDKYAKSG